MPFKALDQSPGLGGRESFVKRGFGMGVEIVLHQHDLLGVREVYIR